MALSVFHFGRVMILQKFVQNYSCLIATRFFLATAEAVVFLGCGFQQQPK